MNQLEITNLLLKKAYLSGLDVEVELSVDEGVEGAVQVQINIKPTHFKDFAIFYGTKDNKVNYSSIFEVSNKYDEKGRQLFEEDRGIYNFYILDDADDEIHLLGEIEVSKFDEGAVDKLLEYLKTEHELTSHLGSIK